MKKYSAAAVALIAAMCAGCLVASAASGSEDQPTPVYNSTRSAVERVMKRAVPRLQYDGGMPADSLDAWREAMSEAMRGLMRHPDAPAASPRKVTESRRDGYVIERWESFPLDENPVAYFVMRPDSADVSRAAVLCIPGSGQTKELLAGERSGNFMLDGVADSIVRRAAMGLHFVKRGLTAVVVDNPCFGEQSDGGVYDDITPSRFLLETGWSYLGLASWYDKVVLDWMKTQPDIDKNRIIVSGFSLGTEPMMALGLLDSSIYAFVYNDFLCRTRERALVLNARDEDGRRGYPNSIRHLIPGFLTQFDFPDIVAALSPRPVICTEGGLDRDFRLIEDAYRRSGAPEAFEWHHYAKYADEASRTDYDALPDGLSRDEFYRMVNVDGPNHYFKMEWVGPWLDRLLRSMPTAE